MGGNDPLEFTKTEDSFPPYNTPCIGAWKAKKDLYELRPFTLHRGEGMRPNDRPLPDFPYAWAEVPKTKGE